VLAVCGDGQRHRHAALIKPVTVISVLGLCSETLDESVLQMTNLKAAFCYFR
jgi:hypothetical protein